jgi:hypothetical protein
MVYLVNNQSEPDELLDKRTDFSSSVKLGGSTDHYQNGDAPSSLYLFSLNSSMSDSSWSMVLTGAIISIYDASSSSFVKGFALIFVTRDLYGK